MAEVQHSTMIERVARALYERTGRHVTDPDRPDEEPAFYPNSWDRAPPGAKDTYRASARAAIAAMRDPIKAITDEMEYQFDNPDIDESFDRAWGKLIDAALAEQP